MNGQQGPLPFNFDGIELPDEIPSRLPDHQNVFLIEDPSPDESLSSNWEEEMPWEDVGLTSDDPSATDEEIEMDRLFGPLRG